MGVRSTYYIKRELAIQIMMQKIMQANNKELEDMLEACEESTYRNYCVEDQIPHWLHPRDERIIETIEEFKYK